MSALVRRAARVLATLVLAGVGIASMSAPAAASTSSPCRQSAAHVAVVIDFGGGNVSTACVPIADGSTGIDVLNARAAQLGVAGPRFNPVNGLLCGIDGYPATGCAERTATGYAYWSYWNGDSGSWTYSNVGPASRRMHEGTVEGWRFQSGTGASTDRPPSAAASFAAICPPATTTTTAAPTTQPPPTTQATTAPTTRATTATTAVTTSPRPTGTAATTSPGLSNGTIAPNQIGTATTSPGQATNELTTVTDPATGEVLGTVLAASPAGSSGASGAQPSGASGTRTQSKPTGASGSSGPSGAIAAKRSGNGTTTTRREDSDESAAPRGDSLDTAGQSAPSGSGAVGPLLALLGVALAAGGAYWLVIRRQKRGDSTTPPPVS